ncbi:MAG TPA: hypothetical protein VG013_00605 [Gemmataceae bacterium]|nr:hypothetical protein [Gemmataceae bacterium]
MLPRTVLLLSAFVLCTSGLFAADHKRGPAKFDAAGKQHVKVTVGSRLKFETNLYRFEFGGQTSIVANGTMKNTSRTKLHGELYFAFFDKDKQLLCAGGQTFYELAPGMKQLVNNPMKVPAEVADRVASYQITVYEGVKQVGQK